MPSSSNIPQSSRIPMVSNLNRPIQRTPAGPSATDRVVNRIKRKSFYGSNTLAAKKGRIASSTVSTSAPRPFPVSRIPTLGRPSLAVSSLKVLNRDNENKENTLLPQSDEIKQLSTKIVTLESSLHEAEKKLSEAEESNKELTREVKDLREETTRTNEEMVGNKRRIEELERKKKDLMTEIDLCNATIDELRDEIDSYKKSLIDTKKKLSEEKGTNRELTSEVSECRDEIEVLKKEVDDWKKNSQRLEKEVEGWTEENQSLRKEILDRNNEIRELHNSVVDLKGQIRVAIRVRPLISLDGNDSLSHLSFPSSTSIGLTKDGREQVYEFNNVFGPNYSQARVFEAVQELIVSSLNGYNVSLIAYGQTGSGKTFTMRGGEKDSAGVIPRAVEYLFQSRDRLADLFWKFSFTASFCEVYNDECYDLLSDPPRKKCEVKMGTGKAVVSGLTTVPITDNGTMMNVLATSDMHRSTASTKCNEFSSRSHALFCLDIKGENSATGATVESVLKLVDLAGSERVKESGVEGYRFEEMTQINGSLSNLQAVIRALMTKATTVPLHLFNTFPLQQKHVPYRNKLLTRLLQDSLGGGSSKSMVIVTLNPQTASMSETKRSLDFAKDMSSTNIGVAKKREM